MPKKLGWNLINDFNHICELEDYIEKLPPMVNRSNEKMICSICKNNESNHQMRMKRLYCSSKNFSEIGNCEYQLKTLTWLDNNGFIF